MVGNSFLSRSSFAISLIALVGIPASAFAALVAAWQLPRLLYGQANLPMAIVEICSLAALLTLVVLLRACLELPSAPPGFYRNILDFLAMVDWHPTVWVTLAGLLILPGWWFLRTDRELLFLWRLLGWRALRQSGDFRDDLDRIVTVYQWALLAGGPLLFCLHMLSRWKSRWRVLPWVLVPLLFAGTAIGALIIGTIMHLD